MSADENRKILDELVSSRARLEAKPKALRANGVPEEDLGYFCQLLEALSDPTEPESRRH